MSTIAMTITKGFGAGEMISGQYPTHEAAIEYAKRMPGVIRVIDVHKNTIWSREQK